MPSSRSHSSSDGGGSGKAGPCGEFRAISGAGRPVEKKEKKGTAAQGHQVQPVDRP